MKTQSVDVAKFTTKIKKLQRQIADLQYELDDVTLSHDDIAAIDEGQHDFGDGRTQRLQELIRKA